MISLVQSRNLPENEKSAIISRYERHQADEKVKSGELLVLSYNTWGLPIELQGHDHNRRFSNMADSLIALQTDIIALQETFHPNLRENLLSKLPSIYYTFSDYRCNKEIIPYIEKDCYGGLMTLSLYPIVNEVFYPYPLDDESSIVEKIGSKGFLLTQIQYGAKKVNIINTHLYAGDNNKAERMRMGQIRFMHSIIRNIPDFNQNQTILLGDFNVHHPDVACSSVYDYITREMSFSDTKPTITNQDYTSDCVANRYVPAEDTRTKLDYIFLKSGMPDNDMHVLNQSRAFDSKQPLSDHFGWRVHMKI